LPDDDRPGLHRLAVTRLDAETLADAVAAVLDGAARLLVCHVIVPALTSVSPPAPRPWSRPTSRARRASCPPRRWYRPWPIGSRPWVPTSSRPSPRWSWASSGP